MYPASNAFHQAVANGNHQIALLLFDDAVFSNSDIDVDRGIEFCDYFNMEENIAIGQALSNELSFSLFNDGRLLNSYAFGEFTATLGVQLSESASATNGNCSLYIGSDMYVGRSTSPYLRKNGSGVSSGPDFPVTGLLAANGKLYCFGANGQYRVYTVSPWAASSETLNTFILDKARREFIGKGITYDGTARSLKIWKDNRVRTYEFVPLGRFIADRPNAPDNIEIDFRCNDTMLKFKEDMPPASALGLSYPTTFKNLLQKLCAYAGVPYGAGNFINYNATLAKEPEEFSNCTMRDVVAWIAEAAGSNARISRDGALILDWLKTTTQALDEGNYSDFQPYWYETQTISKLHNRTTQNDTETTAGEGSVGYLIQDNPLLKGVG